MQLCVWGELLVIGFMVCGLVCGVKEQMMVADKDSLSGESMKDPLLSRFPPLPPDNVHPPISLFCERNHF